MNNEVVIRVEDLSKEYRLGTISHGTLKGDILRWWARRLGRADPTAQIVDAGSGPSHASPPAPGNRFLALDRVSFELRRGEALGVIGRNGAGKSTLLKILSRITAPSSGTARIRGRVTSLLEVGTGFHPELTGRDNIFLNGAILGMSRSEISRKFDAIVDFAEIDRFIDTPVKRYSSGMYVRLAFAVAAHLEPDILILDEVLAVGDARFIKKCMAKMEDVRGHGRALLFVSHSMPSVTSICQNCILIESGRITRQGPAREVADYYLGFAGNQLVGERIWNRLEQAPGDDVARLCAVRARDSHGNAGERFSLREPWTLEVEFRVLRPGQPVEIHVRFYAADGGLLFAAGEFQTEEWHGRPRPTGTHLGRCEIPGNLLNEGMVRVGVSLVTPSSATRAAVDDALQVALVDDLSTEGARGFHREPWPGGALRPRLRWDSSFDPGP